MKETRLIDVNASPGLRRLLIFLCRPDTGGQDRNPFVTFFDDAFSPSLIHEHKFVAVQYCKAHVCQGARLCVNFVWLEIVDVVIVDEQPFGKCEWLSRVFFARSADNYSRVFSRLESQP